MITMSNNKYPSKSEEGKYLHEDIEKWNDDDERHVRDSNAD